MGSQEVEVLWTVLLICWWVVILIVIIRGPNQSHRCKASTSIIRAQVGEESIKLIWLFILDWIQALQCVRCHSQGSILSNSISLSTSTKIKYKCWRRSNPSDLMAMELYPRKIKLQRRSAVTMTNSAPISMSGVRTNMGNWARTFRKSSLLPQDYVSLKVPKEF